MKLHYLLWLALASTCVRAQNDFQLFRPGVQYLYENPDFTNNPFDITSQYYGVRVDSLGRQPLYGSLQIDGVDDRRCVRKVPSPFGYEIAQYADSTVMYFSQTDSLVIYQQAEVGTQWIARDSAGTITYGEVLSQTLNDTTYFIPDVYTAIGFFGPDGRTLLGPVIIIGRDNGLLSGLRFHQLAKERAPLSLAGLSSPQVGVQLPADSSYAPPRVGDRFDVRTVQGIEYKADGSYYFVNERISAEVIAPVAAADNDFTISLRADYLRYLVPVQGGGGFQDSTLTLDTLISLPFRSLPDPLRITQPGEAITQIDGAVDGALQLHVAFDGPCNLLSRRLSVSSSFLDDPDCGRDNALVDESPDAAVTPGIPFGVDSINTMSGPYIIRLLYAKTDTLECGTPQNLKDIIIAVDDYDPAFDRQFSVFPNPSQVGFNVALPGALDYRVQLYNAAGALVQSQFVKGGAGGYLATESLPAGAYFLVVFEQGRAVGRRSVVVRH